MAPFSLVGGYQRFQEQNASIFMVEDLFWRWQDVPPNVGAHLPDYMASYPSEPEYE
jgi:hypothetical protein